jgi:hypothetical protein
MFYIDVTYFTTHALSSLEIIWQRTFRLATRGKPKNVAKK